MSKKFHLISIVGARPNFMKIAPLVREMKNYPSIRHSLVHTGQHYDQNMSGQFFKELGISKPKINLNVGSGSHSVQTAKIMIEFESVLKQLNPDCVLVVGDVNSTLACSLVAKKEVIPVAHVEAGLRSFDFTMPEEINRKVTDSISDVFFTTCEDANENLIKEGIQPENIYMVGNCMIDTLYYELKKIGTKRFWKGGRYAVLTLHRPSNVDNPSVLKKLISVINQIAEKISIVFPAHPRTLSRLEDIKLKGKLNPQIHLIDPLSYCNFLMLYKDADFVLTDSGGIQEETTVLGVPCITLRENTERPITITEGTNVLVGTDPERILKAVTNVWKNKSRPKKRIKYWDGKTSQRIVKILLKKFSS